MRTQYLVRRAVITSVAVVLLSVIVGGSAIAQNCPPGAYEVSRTETATEIEVICDCLPRFKLISGVCKKIVPPTSTAPAGQSLQAEARSWYWLETAGVWIKRKPESCRRACSGGIYHETAGVWIERTPKRDAESCRRACMVGIDSPSTVKPVKRGDTLQDWVHRNWSKAPDDLKWKIQRTLRDPKALKALIMGNQIAISRWHRKATAKGLWRETDWQYVVRMFPAWQVKVGAWWNDDMHQSWVGDARIMIDAGATLTGIRVARFKGLHRSLRAGSNAKSPSSTHYNFPRHYMGPDAPKMPQGLFAGENPYRQAGHRLWYWEEATSVRIKRTPWLNKELKELLTGKSW